MADKAKRSRVWAHFTKFNEKAANTIYVKMKFSETQPKTHTTFDKSEAVQHVNASSSVQPPCSDADGICQNKKTNCLNLILVLSTSYLCS